MSMDFYPITLGTGRVVKKGAPSSFPVPAARMQVEDSLKNEILKRDNQTCQCCGFQSEKYQQILFKDSDPTNFSKDNLLTTCIFCHQCFDLTQVGQMRSGVLLWLPEISQPALNNIAKALYIARISKGEVADVSKGLLDMLMERRDEVNKRLQTDDPFILSTVLNDYLPLKAYATRDKKLAGLRLFPLDRRIIKEADLEFNQFPQILAYWRSKKGPFGEYAVAQWITLYHKTLGHVA